VSLSIVPGLDAAQRGAAAELYWQAFGGKLGRVMGPEPKALAFIQRVMSPGHVLVAQNSAGVVLGVAGFRTCHGSFVGGTFADLREIYGPVSAFWRAAALGLLVRDHHGQGIIVDGLVVRAERRNEGIGEALLEALCSQARTRGHCEISLEVVEENVRARALYQRLGFEVRGKRTSWLTRLLFDFGGVWIMSRKL